MAAPKGNQFAKGNRGGGRPTAYTEDHAWRAQVVARLGATDLEIADLFGVSVSTVNSWKRRHEEFSAALLRGKMIADAAVAEGLFQLAIGYSHPETKIYKVRGEIIQVETTKRYPPNARAAALWLRTRRPGQWSR